ncbi:hypothetical protein [Nitrospira japonica]|uniref:hypothetical protein n=1 Tax=Nitrospira japonica TaxID=1325564 RepID=UPI0012DE0E75|nr:hypothetical protein [Nitrospira japonica]
MAKIQGHRKTSVSRLKDLESDRHAFFLSQKLASHPSAIREVDAPLVRRSSPHLALVKLLAEIAVASYLEKSNPSSAANNQLEVKNGD